jgi:Zn-dependent metalloprotease
MTREAVMILVVVILFQQAQELKIGLEAATVEITVITNSGHPAIDVHWGMEKTYDFYLNALSRNSYDGNGSVIKQYVNPLLYEWNMLAIQITLQCF